MKNLILNKGFRFSFYYRIGRCLRNTPVINHIYSLFFIGISNSYSINIPLRTSIGYGLYIGHPFSIAVSSKAVIGNNVNISQNVTIGYKQTGAKCGAPKIGNNVYIGPNAVIIGNVSISDFAVVGAGAVVTGNIPENAVVAGVPARIISYNGSSGIVNNCWE